MIFKPLAGFWREYAKLMAEHQTTLWLWLLYVIVIGPTWFIARVAGKRFFVRAGVGATYWVARPTSPATIASLRSMG